MKLNYLYAVAFFLSAIFFAAIYFGNFAITSVLLREDGVIESLSAAFYLLGAIFCVFAILKKRFRLFSCLWLFLCIVFFGEETSWLQRQLDYSVPVVEQFNAQSEFNIHNLEIVQDERPVDEDGNLQWNLEQLLTAKVLFRIGLVVYFLLLPLVFSVVKWKATTGKIGYPMPDTFFMVSLWGSIVLSFILAPGAGPVVEKAMSESREMVYSLFIFLYLVSFSRPGNHAAPGK